MLTSFLAAAAAAAPDGGPRPNFMIILADDLGFDLAAAYGHPLSVTPHLDRLARSSFVSTGHHAGGATCAPSRAALMTGRNTMAFPNERNNGIGELPTVTDLLKHQGYETGHFGKWHLEKAAAVGAYGMQTVGGAGSRRRRKGHRQELSLANLTAVERARLKEQADEAEQEARRKEEEAPAPTPLCARAAAADRGADRARLWPAMFQVQSESSDARHSAPPSVAAHPGAAMLHSSTAPVQLRPPRGGSDSWGKRFSDASGRAALPARVGRGTEAARGGGRGGGGGGRAGRQGAQGGGQGRKGGQGGGEPLAGKGARAAPGPACLCHRATHACPQRGSREGWPGPCPATSCVWRGLCDRAPPLSQVHYTLGATPSTKTTPSFCSRAPTSKRSPRDSDVVGAAVAWLRARAGSRPFYANVWLHAPHAPVSLVEAVGRPLCEMLGGTAASVLGATPFGHLLAPRAVDWSAFGRPMGVKLAAARRAAAEGGHPIREGGLEQALAEYLATVWVVDFQIGNLLSVLDDELGLGAQTFVVVSADHGPERPWPFGVTDAELNNMGLAAAGASGDKHTILEGGLLVPFLLRWRGAPAGASTACATSHLDLLPTIAELAGVGVSSPTDGRPQRLWLDGGAAAASCTARSREGAPLARRSRAVDGVSSRLTCEKRTPARAPLQGEPRRPRRRLQALGVRALSKGAADVGRRECRHRLVARGQRTHAHARTDTHTP